MYLHNILQYIITFKSFKCKKAIKTTTIYGINDNIPNDFSRICYVLSIYTG